jgi:predicted dehydrogenase
MPSRREFLWACSAAAAAWSLPSCAGVRPRRRRPGEKVNVGIIGCGGQGGSDAASMAQENVLALCDVDWSRGKGTAERFPQARRYDDFRDLLERETELDAVVISTPDHTHAVPAALAMRRGLHVFVQKPLAHTVHEAQAMAAIAAQTGVVTQMGNQGTAMDGFRAGVETIRSGVLGKVRHVHVWTDRPVWKQGVPRPNEIDPIPAHLRWDLWLGPAPYRPYHRSYAPFHWRGFWDFGTGALGDMGCHLLNLAYFALRLGAPTKVWTEGVVGLNDETGPAKSIVHYEFGETRLTWYDGGHLPPDGLVPVRKLPVGGSILVGDEGTLYSDDEYGARHLLLPAEKFAGWQPPPPSLPRAPDLEPGGSPGRKIHAEWLAAIRGGPRPLSAFDHAGPFTVAVLLGNVALRCGRPLGWDPTRGTTGDAAADRLLRKNYTRGFELDGA